MIDIDALKRDKRPQSAWVVHALIDRLEAAEKDVAIKEEVIDSLAAVVKRLDAQCDAAEAEAIEQARLNGMGSEREAALMAKLEAAEKERDELRESEKWYRRRCDLLQEQQSKMRDPERTIVCDILANGVLLHADFAGDRYTIPGAKGEDGWLRAIDEALVTAHIGIANAHDTYEQAKAKLDNLIGFNVDIAIDPAVNGGYKLVPIVSTHEMDYAGSSHCDWFLSTAQAVWDTMLAVAPEAKP